jgi:hypothetical protein
LEEGDCVLADFDFGFGIEALENCYEGVEERAGGDDADIFVED